MFAKGLLLSRKGLTFQRQTFVFVAAEFVVAVVVEAAIVVE